MTKKKYCGTLKVGTNKYKVFLRSLLTGEDATSYMGQAHHSKEHINMARGYSKYKQYKTFWHEVIHCICLERNINLEESEVDNIGNGIVEVLHDNPWLISMLLEERFIKNVDKPDGSVI